MVAVLLNTGVAFRTSPRADSGSGVKASPAPRSSGARAPGLPSAPFTEHCLPGLLKEKPPALQRAFLLLQANPGHASAGKVARPNYHWQEQARASTHAPRQGFHTPKASGGKTSLWGASPCMGWGCGQSGPSSKGQTGSSLFSDALGTTCHHEDVST